MKKLLWILALWTNTLFAQQFQANGECKKFYPNNELAQKGSFLNGKKTDRWLFFDENGKLSASLFFKDDLLHQDQRFYVDGQLSLEVFFDKGTRDSLWISYLPNRLPQSIYRYQKGVPTGLWEEFFEDGQKAFQMHYKGGFKHGTGIIWLPQNQEQCRFHYLTDLQEGEWYFFDNSLYYYGFFRDGLPHRNWLVRQKDGKLIYQIPFKNGQVEGYADIFEDGQARQKLLYQDGELTQIQILDSTGQVFAQQPLLKGEGTRFFYDQKLQLSAQAHYQNSRLNGNFTLFYPNQQPKAQFFVQNDTLDGKWQIFYENGKLWKEGFFEKGKLHQTLKAYHPNGILAQKANYDTGQLEQEYLQYDQQGKLIEQGNYLNGQKTGFWKEIEQNTIATGNYEQGQKTGLWTFFYPNQQKASQGHYQNNQKTGLWQFWNEKGELIQKGFFENNLKTQLWEFFENNKLRSKAFFKNDLQDSTAILFYPNGEIQQSETWKKGKLVQIGDFRTPKGKILPKGNFLNAKGQRWYYYEDGTPNILANYSNGQPNGKWTYWDRKGKLFAEIHFQNGKKHGIAKFYFPNKRLQAEGRYENDSPKGTWKYYTKKQSLEHQENFDEK